MARGYGVDNVTHMNAFLAIIGAAPVPDDHFERPAPRAKSQSAADQDQVTPPKSQPSSGDNTAGPASPVVGTRAPPSTPATAATASEKVVNVDLDPIQEYEIPEIFAKLSDPKSSLQDSKFACPRRMVYTTLPSRYATLSSPVRSQDSGSDNKLDRPAPEVTRTTVQQEILDKIALRNGSAPSTPITDSIDDTPSKTPALPSFKFEDDVLAKFKARAEAKEKNKENLKVADNITQPFPSFKECDDEFPTNLAPEAPNSETNNGSVLITTNRDSFSPDATEFIPSSLTKVQSPKKQNTEIKARSTESFSETATEPVAAVKGRLGQSTETVAPIKAHLEQNTEAIVSVKSPQEVLDGAKAELIARTGCLSISVKEPGSPEEGSAVVVTASEDPVERQHATHFISWGTPQARTTPRAKVRKVILRGLPVSADLTLVQSLIHGGAIDTYALGTNGTANVTFTTADACDAYYGKYPNGLTVKYKGKNYVVYVEKGTDVNVVSGTLQGHLECGASRCVRAVGADHDWGMAALIKLAEGKTRKGKVEHVSDAWRNEIRTIVFRFTSISDAVTFKAMLVRNDDWEACNIQFMDDPCEKATSVHLE